MTSARASIAAVLLTLTGACAPDVGGTSTNNTVIWADSTGLEKPGTILRFGPAAPEVASNPPSAPVVDGDKGQVSIYEGYFLREPCALPLRVDASHQGDTILVRVISAPDSLRLDTCAEGQRPTGYAVLVGQFEPDDYAVRIVHEGDRARPTPLDTVFDNITIRPRER